MSQKKGTDGWNFSKTYQETRLQSSDPRGEPFGEEGVGPWQLLDLIVQEHR